MDLQEAYHQIDSGVQKGSQKLFLSNNPTSLKEIIFYISAFIFFFWYSYILIFGANSYSLVRDLEMEKRSLKQDIAELREENVRLQRSYFNYKVVEQSYKNEAFQ
jgi:cell division protein FtsB